MNPREFQTTIIPKYVRDWSRKHRPKWCPRERCIKMAGWSGPVGWCVGIDPQRNDLDIITLCQTHNDEKTRALEGVYEYNMKPTEAMEIIRDLTLACQWAFYMNPQYCVDERRLRARNRRRERKQESG